MSSASKDFAVQVPIKTQLHGHRREPILFSSDQVRPSDLEDRPDGAYLFSRLDQPEIGHMNHNLRDPSRRSHTWPGFTALPMKDRPLLKPVKIAGEPI